MPGELRGHCKLFLKEHTGGRSMSCVPPVDYFLLSKCPLPDPACGAHPPSAVWMSRRAGASRDLLSRPLPQDLDCFVIDNNGFVLISERPQEVGD